MRAYTQAVNHRHAFRTKGTPPSDTTLQQRKDVRHAAVVLRRERRTIRLQRTQHDQAWMRLVDEQRAYLDTTRRDGMPDYATYQAADRQWRALREQRRTTLAQRQQDDQAWRAERIRLRSALTELVVTTAWHAILIMTDNGTRQCYNLPLFVEGPMVTSDQVIAALQQDLPSAVEFVISDRGTHFTAHGFRVFAQQHGFLHGLISRRRPQTNGIAERMVRTLKGWLRQKTWQTLGDLEGLLATFLADYTDRPHQGLPLPGLSPNEYAHRLCASVRCAKGC